MSITYFPFFAALLLASIHRGVESTHWTEDELVQTKPQQQDCPSGSGVGEDGLCQVCQPGTAGFGFGSCIPCFPGSFANEAGQTNCTPCPSGTFSALGAFSAASCATCPDGLVVLANATCGVCPPGQHPSYSLGQVCLTCDPDFFKPEAGNDPCLPCPRRSFSLAGATNCTECEENQKLLQDGHCATCAPGQFFNQFNRECQYCESGTFTNYPNVMTQCFLCGGNSFSLKGATECISCPQHQVYIQSSRSCESCAPGSFYDVRKLECEECGYNHFSRGEGETYCTRCAPNSFARRADATCFTCERGLVYIAEIDACGSCEDGTEYDPFVASCAEPLLYFYDTYDEANGTSVTPLPEPSPFLEELE